MLFSEVFWLPVVLLSFSAIARANTLSATGGLQFGRNSGMNDLRNTNPLLGAAYSFDLSPKLELGGFYDYNFLTFQDGSAGALAFMGMLVRYEVAHDRSFFAEVKLGLGEASNSNLETRSLPGYGIGAGYRIPINPLLSVGPRVDLRYLPTSPNAGSGRAAMTDISLMLDFKL